MIPSASSHILRISIIVSSLSVRDKCACICMGKCICKYVCICGSEQYGFNMQ